MRSCYRSDVKASKRRKRSFPDRLHRRSPNGSPSGGELSAQPTERVSRQIAASSLSTYSHSVIDTDESSVLSTTQLEVSTLSARISLAMM